MALCMMCLLYAVPFRVERRFVQVGFSVSPSLLQKRRSVGVIMNGSESIAIPNSLRAGCGAAQRKGSDSTHCCSEDNSKRSANDTHPNGKRCYSDNTNDVPFSSSH